MPQKRNKLDVIYDILMSISEKDKAIKKTHILYKANLSHPMLERYLDEMLSRSLIKEIELKGKKKSYTLTDKGREFIKKYKVMLDFIETF